MDFKELFSEIDWSSWETRANAFATVFMLICSILLIALDSNFRLMFCIVVASSVFFAVLFKGFHFVSPHIHPAYIDMSLLKKKNWNIRLVSTVHAIIVACGGIYYLFEPSIHESILFTYYAPVSVFVCIFAGYCATDMYLTMKYWDNTGGIAIIAHHVIVLMMAVYPVAAQRYSFLAACYLSNELSTPFMNNIHFFKDCAIPKDSKIVKINSLVFMVCFFFCRVVVNTFAAFMILFKTPEFWKLNYFLIASGIILPLSFMILQYYWFALILRNAYRVITAKKPPAEDVSYVQVPDSDDELAENFSIDDEIV